VTPAWTLTTTTAALAMAASILPAASASVTIDQWLSVERTIRGPRWRAMPSGLTPPQKIN